MSYISDPKAEGFSPVVKIDARWYPLSIKEVKPFGEGHYNENDAWNELMKHMAEEAAAILLKVRK